MRVILKTIFCFFIVLSSCTQLSTPVYNDPLYRRDSSNTSKLGKGGEPYIQRMASDGKSSPTFTEKKEKMINTLAAQKHSLKEIEVSIASKTQQVAELEKQLPELEKEHAMMRIEVLRSSNSQSIPGENKETTFKRYTVQDGDTLQRISQKEYGTYTAWLSIYRFNRQQLPNGPNRIYTGQTLYLPVVKDQED